MLTAPSTSSCGQPVTRRPTSGHCWRSLSCVAGVAAVVILTGGCVNNDGGEGAHVHISPFASTAAPLSAHDELALADENTACVANSYEFRVHCSDRTGSVSGVFGGEGDGPGEFRSLAFIRRGPNGTVGVFDLELSRLTVFTPAGVRVAETRLPPGFVPGGPFGTRILGQFFRFPNGDMVPVELDAATGEILWRRDDLDGLAQTECGELIAELPSREGGWVFRACQREIVFLTDRDADAVTTVEVPTYVEELPNERDVESYRDAIATVSGGAGTSLPASAWEPYLTEFRETPKRWFLRSRPMAYDGQDRLWVGTARDRDAFSYLDIYIGTGYVGTVRIRDRLMGYDLQGSTMAALVERQPGRDGIARRAIDWYRIDGLDLVGPPGPQADSR